MQNFNFFRALRSRKGSQIVEATMVLPVTVLILAALIGLLMTFYISLTEQIETHGAEREKLYERNEVQALRLKEKPPRILYGISCDYFFDGSGASVCGHSHCHFRYGVCQCESFWEAVGHQYSGRI